MKNVVGDHALVFMFRPFMGQWVQAIGCFLTKNNADCDVLTNLILEAIGLLEESDYFVDGLISDGAQWNRGMWKNFGIDASKGSCTHPYGENRELFFFSDFPHLIKNVRKYVVDNKTFQVWVFISGNFWWRNIFLCCSALKERLIWSIGEQLLPT